MIWIPIHICIKLIWIQDSQLHYFDWDSDWLVNKQNDSFHFLKAQNPADIYYKSNLSPLVPLSLLQPSTLEVHALP